MVTVVLCSSLTGDQAEAATARRAEFPLSGTASARRRAQRRGPERTPGPERTRTSWDGPTP